MSDNITEFWWASFGKLEPEPVEAEFVDARLHKVRRIGTSIELDPVGVKLISRMDPAMISTTEKALSENLWESSNFLNHKSDGQSSQTAQELTRSKKNL